MNGPTRPSYPPASHFLRDLGIVIERDPVDPERTLAGIEITPALLDASGRPRLGVLATLVDVIAGDGAIRAALPNWAATSDLNLCVDQLPQQGPIEASLRILRSGRQTVLLEASLRAPGFASACGLATLTFMVLPARENDEKAEHFSAAVASRTEFGGPDSGFTQPICTAIGLEPDPEDASIMRLAIVPYVRNSLGALQGGVGAMLLEATAERHASALLEGPVRVRSLAVHYLKLGRVGPVRAVARSLAQTPGGLLTRVELVDEGAEDALLSVATIQVDETDHIS